MKPSELSLQLRLIASAIDVAEQPSWRRVANAIAGVLFATDKSLALSVREALHAEIEKLMPGVFALYDTNPGGKGYKAGYVSFGLVPAQWKDEGIIGGILIQADYDPKSFRSEAPDPPDEKFEHSKKGGIVELAITGCYYNKLQGGGCDPDVAVGIVGLSGADVYVDAKEKVISIELVDPGMLKDGLASIVKDIAANPPDYAQSEERKRKNDSPTGSPASLLKWLSQNNRSSVGRSEIDALARAQSAKTGKAMGNAKRDIEDFFKKRGWAIDPNA